MTIKVGSIIQKLDPSDTYKLLDAGDIQGLDTIINPIRATLNDVKAKAEAGLSKVAANTKDLETLKTQTADPSTGLAAIKTEVDNVYAKDKATFDQLVNALVDAKLANFKPPKELPKMYAVYGSDVPTSLTGNGTASTVSGVFHLVNPSPQSARRIFVMVPNDKRQAELVTGFSVDDAPVAKWQSRAQNYNNVAYKVFYSTAAYSSAANKVEVKFSDQE